MSWRRLLGLSWFVLVLSGTTSSDGLASVNTTYNPCTNFYSFSCTPWLLQTTRPTSEPIWNPLTSVSHQIKRRILTILNRHDPSLSPPKMFYRSCIASDSNGAKYLRELQELVHDLGDWPLVAAAEPSDWLTQLSQITRRLGIHPLIKITADLDYKDTTKSAIYIEPGTLVFPLYILTNRRYDKEVEAYEAWILDTIRHVYGHANSATVSEVREIVKFEMRLARFMEIKPKSARISLSALTKTLRGVVATIFQGVTQISPNNTVIVRNYSYLKNVLALADKLGNRAVSNYLIWCVVKDLSRDTTAHMRRLNFFIDKAILGVEEDLPRQHECLNKVIEYFSPLLVPHYLKSYVDPQIFARVHAMFASIKTQFVNVINDSRWMSEGAKQLSSKKIHLVRMHLGFDGGSLRGAHQRFQKIQLSEDHFRNIIELKQFTMMVTLCRFYQKPGGPIWPSSPFEVNAYYSILQNSIFIPLGLLERPFFALDGDEVLNFGALGSLIGHELSHALDPLGITADWTGTVTKWFPAQDLAVYKKRTQCFGGDNTLGENIADSNGLRISLAALKDHTSRDLYKFFVAFSQMWCELSTNSDMLKGEEHGVGSERVQSLSYNPDFREMFKCGNGSSCQLW